MISGKVRIIRLTARLIEKISLNRTSYFPERNMLKTN